MEQTNNPQSRRTGKTKAVAAAGRTVTFIWILLVLASIGSSEEQKSVPLDEPSLYGENTLTVTPTVTPSIPLKDAVVLRTIEMMTKENQQVVYILELDLSNPGLEVFPVLSEDRIFGYEALSKMDQRYKAAAAVNAGFNFSYGQPSGFVVQNGRLLSGSMGYGRTLLIKDQKAWFQNTSVKVWLEWEGEQFPVDRVNPFPEEKGILIFTPEYGPTTRIEGKYTTCIVENNRVVSSSVTDGETDIPKNGFLIVDLRVENSPLLRFSSGQSVDLRWENQVFQGYQCSGSLVEKGVEVAKDMDPWAGNLRIPTPRTAVGIKDDHTLIFVVVDGRQPGYSIGVTGEQLADILISIGVTEAAVLDGGASSEIIVAGEIANRPSTGKERLLASGFIIRYSQ